jgi:ATP-dependent protease Clp ATPase subunit
MSGEPTIYCGFCGHAHYEVERLFVAAADRTICLSCASLCLEIYRQETQRQMAPGDIGLPTTPHEGASHEG